MTRLFAHRGFASGNISQNSIASLKAAYENDFRGVEFDIWFLNSKLVLKHDMPQVSEINSLPQFADYFSYGNEIYYWLDFKNLDEKNAAETLALVKQQLDAARIDMNRIYFAPFITDYKIAERIFAEIRKVFGNSSQLIAVCEELENNKDAQNLHNFLLKNNVKFLSIFHKLIDENFAKLFADIKLFAWTVNDLPRLRELEKLGVTNFATDKITPQNYEGKTQLSRT